mmetsp:Transcript_35317/g.108408  ORF Transcript_35317/g.108408 Transcript_35317/m.108408 type:complete len:587 (+) Transcript_35317:95-1855(+)
MKLLVALAVSASAASLRGIVTEVLYAKEGRTQMEIDVKTFQNPRWTRGARVAGDELIELEFWLKHCPMQTAEFHDDLVKRSTPGSPLYGKWLSNDQVRAKLAPSREAVDAVVAYATHELGAKDIHLSNFESVVSVSVPASVVEAKLETVLHHHAHKDYATATAIRATSPYSLPSNVAAHVSLVGELLRLPRLKRPELVQFPAKKSERASNDDVWSACGAEYNEYTNPAVLAARYGFAFPQTTAAEGNALGLAEFQGQYYDTGDLEAFSTACGLAQTINVSKTTGGNMPSICSGGGEACVESLLDIEYAGAIAGAIPLEVYYSSSYSLLDWANALQSADDPAPVHSVSYGNDEAQQTGAAFMESVNTAFMKLSNTGISILFAAGDQGVWGREGVIGGAYHPDFPAGSPYVTAVGGTNFATASTIGDETTWNDGGSGFSNEFGRPSFQDDEVTNYLSSASDLPKASMYNASGRAYPDLAALAGLTNAYLVALGGGSNFAAVGGTSAASPTVAAMIAQINDLRLAADGSSLGWLNPALYTCGQSCFNDVTTGATSGGKVGGFPASEGWDAATGFGTVDFAKLSACLTSN